MSSGPAPGSTIRPRRVLDLGSLNAPQEVALRLFDLLRQADREGLDCIFSEGVEPRGLGLAIMNRLGRAASFRVLDADKAGVCSPIPRKEAP